MFRRQNLMPRRLGDRLCFLALVLFLPICFVYNTTFILPYIHEPGSTWFILSYLAYIFAVFNIIGNFLACWMIDTSVNVKKLKVPNYGDDALSKWHQCSKCDNMMPPRSWHCETCNCCILKLSHHCLFTGNCIGHFNVRYFAMFVIYVSIGGSIALAHTSYYLWNINWDTYGQKITILKLMAPHLLFFYGLPNEAFNLLMLNFTALCTILGYSMILYHFPVFLRGGVCYERKIGEYPYDNGNWRSNLREILGIKMHRVWLSPLIMSPLPNDGTQWTTSILKSKSSHS